MDMGDENERISKQLDFPALVTIAQNNAMKKTFCGSFLEFFSGPCDAGTLRIL